MRSHKVYAILVGLLLIFGSIEGKGSKYYISVCAIFNNEADIMKEWIEFHRMQGVEHFYLYNNNSTDDYLEVLSPYIQEKIVELIDWPSPPEKNWTGYQMNAYNDCIHNHKDHTTWLAFIDTDEFIVFATDETLPEFLSEFEHFGGVKIYWQNFGTSHLAALPPGGLLTENLIRKFPWDYLKNQWGKCIVRPKRVKEYYVHDGVYRSGYCCVTPSKKKEGKHPPLIDRIRLNHYWTRTEDFFYGVKIPRVERYTGKVVSQEQIDKILDECNREEDTTVHKYLDELKQRMGLNL